MCCLDSWNEYVELNVCCGVGYMFVCWWVRYVDLDV